MAAELDIGAVVDGAYKVREHIGEGGFGHVYRACQLSMERDVALKIVENEAAGDTSVERFRREVLAVRNLAHPNTIRIFDFAETDAGELYYTMEYLEGETLAESVERGAEFGLEPVRQILVQILKSLSEAHTHGIVHRDLKPENVMLADIHGEEYFVKVLDFGIAKAMHPGSDKFPDKSLTAESNLVGTLRYMAPEQAGEAPIGAHTDLYAVGLVGLELLSGEKVFTGLSNIEIFQAHTIAKPLVIPERIAASPLGEVLRRALEKDYRDRYESAAEMREALEAIPSEKLREFELETSRPTLVDPEEALPAIDSNLEAPEGVDLGDGEPERPRKRSHEGPRPGTGRHEVTPASASAPAPVVTDDSWSESQWYAVVIAVGLLIVGAGTAILYAAGAIPGAGAVEATPETEIDAGSVDQPDAGSVDGGR